jgi:hypothetical protein
VVRQLFVLLLRKRICLEQMEEWFSEYGFWVLKDTDHWTNKKWFYGLGLLGSGSFKGLVRFLLGYGMLIIFLRVG